MYPVIVIVLCPVSVQSPCLSQCTGSEYCVSISLQHSAVALPHPGSQAVPQAAALLPSVDVREARPSF